MRLTEAEKSAILNAFKAIAQSNNITGRLFLFGSRTKDSLRGGDIDLLWIGPKLQVDLMRSLKFDILAKIKLQIDEQKIDITIVADENSSSDEFYQSIKCDLIELY